MIRLLGTDDVDVFRQIRMEALSAEPAAFASSTSDWQQMSEDAWRQRLLDDPVFVSFDGGEPVAIMGLLRQRASKMVHRATIIMVYVRKEMRGTGVAGSLLDFVVDYARENGIRQLELTASVENTRAIQFYRNAGFADVGLIPAGVIDGGREIDDLIMVRRIA
ncbi:GNAT family N-acetyltransferase [Rhizobium sp. 18055]|uniref:GNAT family N-acetyltransferase n=1 Tax=Rhizobium sp. 18055 TaxID=2681403 RepID=UPI0013572923|nr:GNAT family N-acetyltransferase [Rhizobium sp. 18055]